MNESRYRPARKGTLQQFAHLSLSADGTLLRKETLNGIEYLVVPCVSKIGNNVEWPINSEWPVFIPSEVLALAADNRNNRPVVLNHPQDKQGNYVSANSPGVLTKYSFGFVFSAAFDNVGNKITCEMWLDKARAKEIGTEAVAVINKLENGGTVEVSEGNFVLYERTEGEYNGKKYGAIWHACWSDHLACLPEGFIGACAIDDGCGAYGSGMYASVGRETSVVYVLSALAQARTPQFSGTESGLWSKPSYEECIRYLYNGDSPPKSVVQCGSDLKRTIASHSLMGDPEANNYADLTSCMCVSVSSGKLNERALRGIVAGKSMSGLSDAQKKSAIDTAQRLLNSEFSANLQVAGTDSESPGVEVAPRLPGSSRQEACTPVLGTPASPTRDELSRERDHNTEPLEDAMTDTSGKGLFSRLLKSISSLPGVLRNGMSANRLKNKLWTAISDIEPGLYWVEDYDPDTKLVWYTTRLVHGDEYYGETEMHSWQRSFSVDVNENVTINNDRQEVEFVGTYKVIVPVYTETEIVASSATATAPCACHKGDTTMEVAAKKKLIARLCASGAPLEGSEKGLEAMSDKALEALDKTYPEVVQVANQAATASNSETVTLTREEYAEMKAVNECFKAQQAARRTELITAISASQANTFADADLQSMDTGLLEKLAQSLSVNQPASEIHNSSASYVGLPIPANGQKKDMRKLPDTWGMSKNKTPAQT